MYSREFGRPFVSTAWGSLANTVASSGLRTFQEFTPHAPHLNSPTKALHHFRPLGLDAEAIQQRQQLLQRLRGDRLEVLTKAEDALEGRDLLHLRELCSELGELLELLGSSKLGWAGSWAAGRGTH